MAVIAAGGELDVFAYLSAAGQVEIAALQDITLWSAEQGGIQWDSVIYSNGQVWPGGVGRTGADGRVPSCVVDIGAADPASVEVWVQRQAQPGARYRLGTGPVTAGTSLNDLELPGKLIFGSSPNDVQVRAKSDGTSLEQSVDGGSTWTAIAGGGGGEGGNVYYAAYASGAWPPRPTGGTSILVIWISLTAGVGAPAEALAHDIVRIA